MLPPVAGIGVDFYRVAVLRGRVEGRGIQTVAASTVPRECWCCRSRLGKLVGPVVPCEYHRQRRPEKAPQAVVPGERTALLATIPVRRVLLSSPDRGSILAAALRAAAIRTGGVL
jgi:hypothetical protein